MILGLRSGRPVKNIETAISQNGSSCSATFSITHKWSRGSQRENTFCLWMHQIGIGTNKTNEEKMKKNGSSFPPPIVMIPTHLSCLVSPEVPCWNIEGFPEWALSFKARVFQHMSHGVKQWNQTGVAAKLKLPLQASGADLLTLRWRRQVKANDWLPQRRAGGPHTTHVCPHV